MFNRVSRNTVAHVFMLLGFVLVVLAARAGAQVEIHYCKYHSSSEGAPLHTCWATNTDGSGQEDACWNLEDDCNGSGNCAEEWELRECTASEDSAFPSNYGFQCYRASQVCGDGDEIECFGIGGSYASEGKISCQHYRCDPEVILCTNAFPPEVDEYTCANRPPGQ